MSAIQLTNGETFEYLQSVDLARLVFVRFGQDVTAAAEAWRRLLGNSCAVEDFMRMVHHPEHTPHCAGWCAECVDEDEQKANADSDADLRDLARESVLFGDINNDDCEVDGDCAISRTEDGAAWIQVWIYLRVED